MEISLVKASLSCSLHFPSAAASALAFCSPATHHHPRLTSRHVAPRRICGFLGRRRTRGLQNWEFRNGFRNPDILGENSVFRKGLNQLLRCPNLKEQRNQWPQKKLFHIDTRDGRLGCKTDSTHGVVNVRADEQYPQNEDLPPVLPKRKKRPYLTPIKRGSFEKKLRRRAGLIPVKPLKAPENGILVEKLIPVAHTVLAARAILLDGVARLLKDIPVQACRACPELYVGREGHEIRSCQGHRSSARFAEHDWIPAYLDDVVVPVEAFHLADRLAKVPTHEQRFDIDRIPAIVELCIQAGVDLPEYPTRRRTSPVKAFYRHGGALDVEDVQNDESDMEEWRSLEDGEDGLEETEEMERSVSSNSYGGSFNLTTGMIPADNVVQLTSDTQGTSGAKADDDVVDPSSNDQHVLATNVEGNLEYSSARHSMGMSPGGPLGFSKDRDCSGNPPAETKSEESLEAINDEDSLQTVAQKTVQAWDTLRSGAIELMKRYPVKACGYCPEVHMGPRGHRVRLCGAFKHQWRKGQHGWQDAALDDFIPPRYVWHVRDIDGPPLKNSLRTYYGQAPIVVELCSQAGATVPEKYRPRMRLDVVIPDLDEYEMVA